MTVRRRWLAATMLLGAVAVSVGLLRSAGGPSVSPSRASRLAGRRGAVATPKEIAATPGAVGAGEGAGFLEQVVAPILGPVRVTGCVVTAAGEPVPEARVWGFQEGPDAGVVLLMQGPLVRSGASGEFELSFAWGTKLVAVGAEAPQGSALRRRLGPAHWGRLDVGALVLEMSPRVEGRVVDADGNAVAGASIGCWRSTRRADGDPDLVVRTGEDGSFSLEAVQIGETLSLVAVHDRFAPCVVENVRAGGDLIVIVMSPGASVRGVVRDDRGAPLPGVRIETDSVRTTDPMRPWIRVVRATTGDDGAYALRGLPLGTFHVWPVAFGWSPEIRSLDLSEPDEVVADFVLHPLERIPGVVVDAASGAPIAGVTVSDAETASDSDGRFVLARPAPAADSSEDSARLVVASKAGWVDARAAVEPGDREVRMEMRRAAAVNGLVLDEQGRPLVGARVVPQGRHATFVTPMWTNAGGVFASDRLPPDSYDGLEVAHRGHPRRLLPAFDIREGETKQWTIVLGLGRGVAGRVLDRDTGRPIALADVAVWRLDERWFEDAVCATDRDGRFRLTGIAAGPTRLLARAPGRLATLTPTELPDDPATLADATVLLDRALVLEGEVVGPSGEPVAGAHLWAKSDAQDSVRELSPSDHTRTDAHGRFRFDELPDAPVTLRAASAGVTGGGFLTSESVVVSPPFAPVKIALVAR
jgi:carboxypeptidase family protein